MPTPLYWRASVAVPIPGNRRAWEVVTDCFPTIGQARAWVAEHRSGPEGERCSAVISPVYPQ